MDVEDTFGTLVDVLEGGDDDDDDGEDILASSDLFSAFELARENYLSLLTTAIKKKLSSGEKGEVQMRVSEKPDGAMLIKVLYSPLQMTISGDLWKKKVNKKPNFNYHAVKRALLAQIKADMEIVSMGMKRTTITCLHEAMTNTLVFVVTRR